MRRVVGLTRKQLELRERVFEGLVTRALRQTVKAVSTGPAVVTAAAESSAAPASIPATSATATATAALAPVELAAVSTTWSGFVTTELYPFLVETYLAAAQGTAEAVAAATGVVIEALSASSAEAFLVSAPNALQLVGDQLWEQLRAQLAEGYAAGESTHQLAARIRETVKLTEPKALLVARSTVIPAANAASLEQVQLVFSDEECAKEWLATDDARTREAHRKADGQRVPVHQNFTVGGEALPYPGWPGGSADNVLQCRCSLAFVFDDDEDDDVLVADAEIPRRVVLQPRNGTNMPLTAGVDWDPDEHPRDRRDGRFVERVTGVAVITHGGFDYLDDDDAVDMHNEMQADDPWTPEQEFALAEYAGVAYQEMNGLLRDTEDFSAPARKEIQKLIDDANAAMRSTTQSLRTARGVESFESFGLPKHGLYDPLDELGKLRGRKFREPGFFSTSTRESWGDGIRDNPDAIFLEIDVPEGTPAAYLAAPYGPGIRSEGELLLASGLTYELVDVFQNPGEAVTVRLRVVS